MCGFKSSRCSHMPEPEWLRERFPKPCVAGSSPVRHAVAFCGVALKTARSPGCSVVVTRSVWGGDHGGSIPPIPTILLNVDGGAICTSMSSAYLSASGVHVRIRVARTAHTFKSCPRHHAADAEVERYRRHEIAS